MELVAIALGAPVARIRLGFRAPHLKHRRRLHLAEHNDLF
jgi:hypothetical protein